MTHIASEQAGGLWVKDLGSWLAGIWIDSKVMPRILFISHSSEASSAHAYMNVYIYALHKFDIVSSA